jgi:pimeloyl-ACP methyl ester carboxylesterase
LQLDRYVIWLHDYGSQFGFRLAVAKPERVAGLVIQNGDIYEDAFGPKYDLPEEVVAEPRPTSRCTPPQFPKEQAYLREHQPPTLIVWGPHDGYMPESRHGPTTATCPTRRCICSAAGIGCWRPT